MMMKMIVLLLSLLIGPASGCCIIADVGAMIPAGDNPITIPGIEMYYSMQNVVGGQVKGWPNYAIATKNITTVDGVIDNALYFIGQIQILGLGVHRDKCSGNLEMCPNGFSLSFYIKTDDFSDGAAYFYFSSGGDSVMSHGVGILAKENKFVVKLSTTTKKWRTVVLGENWQSDVWNSVVITWTEADGSKLYLNGELAGSGPVAKDRTLERGVTEFDNMYIGAPNTKPATKNGRFAMDEVMFFNVVLPQDKIQKFASRVQ